METAITAAAPPAEPPRREQSEHRGERELEAGVVCRTGIGEMEQEAGEPPRGEGTHLASRRAPAAHRGPEERRPKRGRGSAHEQRVSPHGEQLECERRKEGEPEGCGPERGEAAEDADVEP